MDQHLDAELWQHHGVLVDWVLVPPVPVLLAESAHPGRGEPPSTGPDTACITSFSLSGRTIAVMSFMTPLYRAA